MPHRPEARLARSLLIASALLLLFCPGVFAKVRIVRNGAPEPAVFDTIQSAVTEARPGDVIEIGPGIYRESVRIRGKRDLTLRGPIDGGAIIRPDRTLQGWKAVPAPLKGVYRIENARSLPYFATYRDGDERVRLFVYNGACRSSRSHASACKGKSKGNKNPDRELAALDRLHFGPGLFFDERSKSLFVKLEGGRRPGPDEIRVASLKDRAIAIDGASQGISIEHLVLRHGGKSTLWITNAATIRVEHCEIDGGLNGVWIDRPARDVTIRGNVVRGAFHRDPHWEDFKTSIAMDGSGIVVLRAGPRNVIAENHVHGWFDGISVGYAHRSRRAEMNPRATDNDEIEIRGNLIEDIYDDAMELEGFIRSGRVAGNLIRNSLVGFALAARFGDGDLVFYRNRVFTTRRVRRRRIVAGDESDEATRPMRALATKLGLGFDPTSEGQKMRIRVTENLAFHHNTFLSIGLGLAGGFANQARGDLLPRRVVWNENVFVTLDDAPIVKTGAATQGVDLDGNLYWQVEPWSHRGKSCDKIRVRDFGLATTGDSNAFCGLAAAREVVPTWEASGIEADPGWTRLDFERPDDTPLPASPLLDPEARVSTEKWPDEAILATGVKDRGALERVDAVRIDSISPSVVSARGPTHLVVRGAGFDGRTRVHLGDAPAAETTLVSSTTLFVRLAETAWSTSRVVEVRARKGDATAIASVPLRVLAD